MTAFEDGLWERLVDSHDADDVRLADGPHDRGRHPLMLGGSLSLVAAAAAAAVIAITAGTGATPAYALSRNADGSITVTIHDLSTAVPQLNAEFARMGIDETVIPVTAACSSNGTPVLGLGLQATPQATSDESFTFTPGRGNLLPGYHGFLAAEQLSNGEIAMAEGAVEAPMPSCFPTTAYRLQQFGTTADGVPEYRSVPVDPNAPGTSATTTGTTTGATTTPGG